MIVHYRFALMTERLSRSGQQQLDARLAVVRGHLAGGEKASRFDAISMQLLAETTSRLCNYLLPTIVRTRVRQRACGTSAQYVEPDLLPSYLRQAYWDDVARHVWVWRKEGTNKVSKVRFNLGCMTVLGSSILVVALQDICIVDHEMQKSLCQRKCFKRGEIGSR